MANNSVSTNTLVDGCVTNAKLATLSIATGNIQNSAVTNAKLADLNLLATSSCSSYSTSSATFTQITNFTKDFTGIGRPIYLCLQSDGSGGNAVYSSTTVASQLQVEINGSAIFNYNVPVGSYTGGVFLGIYTGASSGTNTFAVYAKTGGTFSMTDYKFFVYEL